MARVKEEEEAAQKKVRDIIKQQADMEGRYKEEHHKTVVYFEEKIQDLSGQIQQFKRVS